MACPRRRLKPGARQPCAGVDGRPQTEGPAASGGPRILLGCSSVSVAADGERLVTGGVRDVWEGREVCGGAESASVRARDLRGLRDVSGAPRDLRGRGHLGGRAGAPVAPGGRVGEAATGDGGGCSAAGAEWSNSDGPCPRGPVPAGPPPPPPPPRALRPRSPPRPGPAPPRRRLTRRPPSPPSRRGPPAAPAIDAPSRRRRR